MSWFKKSQIWQQQDYPDVDEYSREDSLITQEIFNLYRYSFIYNEIRRRTSQTGMEMMQRFENILNSIRQQIIILGNSLKRKVLYTFDKWLEGHAITDPGSWANSRIKANQELVDEGLEELVHLRQAVGEYNGYFGLPGVKSYHIFLTIMEQLSKMPLLKELIENTAIGVLDIESPEDLREIYGVPNGVDPERYIIDQMKSGNLDAQDIAGIDGLDSLYDLLENNPEADLEVSHAFYRDKVFPLWYARWSPKGIDKTRQRMENIANELRNADPVDTDRFLATINVAIHSAHQTGSMTEYLETDWQVDNSLDELLRELSDGKWNGEWNKQVDELFGIREKAAQRLWFKKSQAISRLTNFNP